MFVRASLDKRREENQLDATEWFIALIICSTCFGHLQKSIVRNSRLHLCCYRIWCVMPWLLVVGGQVQGIRLLSSLHFNRYKINLFNFPYPGRIACCPAPDRRPSATKALHTICGNNISVASSCWRWAYKCPKHVEQIISAINLSALSSWFSSLYKYSKRSISLVAEVTICNTSFYTKYSHSCCSVLRLNSSDFQDRKQLFL